MKALILFAVLSLIITRCDRKIDQTYSYEEKFIKEAHELEDSVRRIKPFKNRFVDGQTKFNDSLLIDLFMRAKYNEIIEKNIKLDSDTAIGLVSVSYLRLKKYAKAFNCIKHFNDCDFRISMVDSTIEFPRDYPKHIGIYEKWAMYHYLFLRESIFDLRGMELQLLSSDQFYYKTDTLKGCEIVRVDYLVKSEKIFKGTDSLALKYIEANQIQYPYWKELKDLKDTTEKYME